MDFIKNSAHTHCLSDTRSTVAAELTRISSTSCETTSLKKQWRIPEKSNKALTVAADTKQQNTKQYSASKSLKRS